MRLRKQSQWVIALVANCPTNTYSHAHPSQVPSFTPSIGQSFASMVVPTTDLVRLTFLTELLVGMKR